MRNIKLPLTAETIKSLRAGDTVLLSGEMFTARDAAHKKLIELLDCGKPLPFDMGGAAIYYTGPTPRLDSAGPTTSARMDGYTPCLLEKGLAGMIGKGERSEAVREAIKKHKAVYFAAVGGAGAYYADCITSSAVIAFPELGSEAVYILTVKDFPLIVAIDSAGNTVYNK